MFQPLLHHRNLTSVRNIMLWQISPFKHFFWYGIYVKNSEGVTSTKQPRYFFVFVALLRSHDSSPVFLFFGLHTLLLLLCQEFATTLGLRIGEFYLHGIDFDGIRPVESMYIWYICLHEWLMFYDTCKGKLVNISVPWILSVKYHESTKQFYGCFGIELTLPKTNMDTQNDGLEKGNSLQT